jgi:lauroyl/myristoyl acyltransferase
MESSTAIVHLKFTHALLLLTLFYPLRWLVRCLSWRQALRVASCFGTLHAWMRRDRLSRHIREGIQAVWRDELSETTLKQLVRHNLVTRYKHLVDSFFYQRLDEDLIERTVPEIEGRTHLDAMLNSGKGAILLVSHFGSFGLLIGGLAFRGYRLHQILTLTPQSQYRTWPCLERAIVRAKLSCWSHERVGFEFWRPGKYLRPLYRKLLLGEILLLYGDGVRGGQYTSVDFLGFPLSLSTGPFRIAARAHVALIPAFIIRATDNRHRIILEQPIMLPDGRPSSIQQGANQYAAVLAQYVHAHPDHWFTWARLARKIKGEKCWLEFSSDDTDPSEFYTPHPLRMGRR